MLLHEANYADRIWQFVYKEAGTQINRCSVGNKAKENEDKIILQEEEIEHQKANKLVLVISLVLCIIGIIVTVIIIKLLQKRNHSLTEMNKFKATFNAIIAHDIKNPIVAQKKTLDMLVRHFDNFSKDELKDICLTMKTSTDALNDLLLNLLTCSNIKVDAESGCSKVPLIDVIREVLPLFEIPLTDKALTLEIEVSNDIIVQANRSVLTTLLRNFISNAVKFSYPGGRILITVEEKEKEWLVCVSDEGVGIKQEDIDKLYRTDLRHMSKGTNGEEGTGLGLIICKRIIERFYGRILIKSQLGKGSTFGFTIKKHIENKTHYGEY